MKSRLALLALALIPQLSGCAIALREGPRNPAPLAAGQRVRVHLRRLQPRVRTATLLALSEDSIALLAASDSERVTLPVAELRGLEVSGGVRYHPWRAAAAGVAIGGFAGIVAGVRRDVLTDEGMRRLGTSINRGLLTGGVVGLIAGLAIGTEEWADVPLDRLSGLRIGVVAGSSGR